MYGLVISDLFLVFCISKGSHDTLLMPPPPLPGSAQLDETPSDQVDLIVLLAAVDGFSSLGAETIINPVRH